MRADGSIKDMTTGLSTVDKSQWRETQYMKLCTNMQNSKQEGLVRRPPAELILNTWTDERARLITDFEPGRDILIPFEIDYDPYWLYAQLDPEGEWYDHTVHVFDADGVNIPCDNLTPNYEYFLGVRGNRDVAMASNGDGLYLVNKQKRVKALEGSQPLGVNQSIVVVKTAPKVHQQVAITWEYPDQTQGQIQYVVGEDHATQPIPKVEDVDNGVNTIGDALAAAINAQITTDGQTAVLEAKSRGGSVVFERAVPDFSNVIVHAGDNDILAINGEVANVLELPKYAHNGQIVAVAPEPTTARAAFYMRSELILGDEVTFPLPAADWEFTAGQDFIGADDDRVISGFTSANGDGQFNTFGTWTSSTDFNPVDYPDATWVGLTLRTPLPVREKQSTTVEAWLLTTGNTSDVPSNEIPYMEIWDVTSNPPKRKIQSFMYQEVANEPQPGQLFGSFVWRGTVDGGARLVDGRDYAVYFYDVAASQVEVPEVRWVEESSPDEDTLISSSTFVHALHRRGDGTFEFGDFASIDNRTARPLTRRRSGDDISNAFPAFIDKKLRDVATFQSRLAVLADDKVSLSVTGQPHDWFRGTVTQLLDTGPINIQSTAAEATSLRHFVQHNSDLLVFGPAGQFKLDGTTPMTPATAAMPKTASFISDLDSKPVASGNDVFFATDYGTSAGISRYTLSANIEGLAIGQPLMDNQIDLVPGNITRMVVSPNLGLLVARSTNFKNELWVMEYDVNAEFTGDFIPAWSKWELEWGCRVLSMRMNGDFLDIIAVGKAIGGADENPANRPLECGTYQCDAYDGLLTEIGGQTIINHTNDEIALPPWEWAAFNTDDSIHIVTNYVSGGQLVTAYNSAQNDQGYPAAVVVEDWGWDQTSENTPAFCGGARTRVASFYHDYNQFPALPKTAMFRYGNQFNTTDPWDADFIWSMIFCGWNGTNRMDGEILRNSPKIRTADVRYFGNPSQSSVKAQPVYFLRIIDDPDNSGEKMLQLTSQARSPNTSYNVTTMPLGKIDEQWNHIAVKVTTPDVGWQEYVLEEDEDDRYIAYWHTYIEILVNGVRYPQVIAYDSANNLVNITNPDYRPEKTGLSQPRTLTDCNVSVAAMAVIDLDTAGNIDLANIGYAYERNYVDYVAPAACDLYTPIRENPDPGWVRLYRMNLFGNRKTRKRFDNPEDQFGDVYLDCRQVAEDVTTTVTLPEFYPEWSPFEYLGTPPRDVTLVQGVGCPEPGEKVDYTRVGDVLTLDEDMTGGEVFYGYNYGSYVTIPEVDIRDAAGVIQTDASLRVADYTVTLTGYMNALVNQDWNWRKPWEATYPEQVYKGVVMGTGTTDSVNYERGQFRVQFRQDPNRADLTLRSVDYLGMDIHQIEWRGAYYNSGRRF